MRSQRQAVVRFKILQIIIESGKIRDVPVDILRDYHRLSGLQIDAILGEGTAVEDAGEKIKALQLAAELVRIGDRLSEQGIDFIPLKGPVLAQRLYGDVTARICRDLDILVSPAQLVTAVSVLQSLGYVRDEPWPEKKRSREILISHTNEEEFVNSESGIIVELHWRLLRVPVVSHRRLEELTTANTVDYSFAGRSFRVLNRELGLLFLIHHGGIHWWRRLKWLTDIREILKEGLPDKRKFSMLATELGAGRMIALCNEMLKLYFGDTDVIPAAGKLADFMAGFAVKRIDAHRDPVHDFYGRALGSVWYSLISYAGIRYKLRILRNYLFVHSYFGRGGVLTSLPLFYVYGPLKLLMLRLKR